MSYSPWGHKESDTTFIFYFHKHKYYSWYILYKIYYIGGGSLVAKSCLSLCDPMNYSPPGSSIHGILQARILEWVAIPFSWVSSQPRDRTQVSSIAGRFFTSWQGKPKNTGVGSLSLLQQIFLTQELNWNILHCRLILYQLSYREAWHYLSKHCPVVPAPIFLYFHSD